MISDLALQVVRGPLYRGPLEGATHYGYSDPPGDGPYVQVWLVIGDGVIRNAAFKSPGCPSSLACGGVLCALITGREAVRAAELTAHDLAVVVGDLPEGKGHYLDRAIRALQKALANNTNSA